MTNTKAFAPARWVTSSPTAKSGYNSVVELFRLDAPADEVAALFTALTQVRGVHRVEISRRPGVIADRRYVESSWFGLYVRGTDRGVVGAANLLMLSGLQELDRNADHDHEDCIVRARAMGVPAAYAHTPETYLST